MTHAATRPSRDYRQALALDTDLVEAHCGLAAVLADKGRLDEAIVHYQQALKLQPDHAGA